MPELLTVGLSHRTAPVEVRGRLARLDSHGGAWLAECDRRRATILESFVLATCHRIECYVVAGDLAAAGSALRGAIARAIGMPADAVSLRLTGFDAVEHLCRVASGLDSMILGEAEIAGQVRRAAMAARAARTIGPWLELVIAGALGASGRARSQTRIGVGAFSASTAAVALAETLLGGLTGRSALVIGAGQAGRQALERLARRRLGRLVVASRSASHAAEAASRTGAETAPLGRAAEIAAGADLVVAATVASGYVVRRGSCENAWAASTRDRLLVDLSVPRVIDPSIAGLPRTTLRTVDDLGEIVRASAARREAEIPRVEAIIAREAARAYSRFQQRRSA